ncbi:MAG: hypothetical protein JXR97_16940 [Planctomycetes bacterium]|nr:hypothetical protein [Planctomycetota bacterium]
MIITVRAAVLFVFALIVVAVLITERFRGRYMAKGICPRCGKRDVRLYAARHKGKRVFVCTSCISKVDNR